MLRARRTDARLTALALLIVLGSAVAGLVSNDLPSHLPHTMQVDPLVYFFGTLGILFLVSIALIFLERLAPERSLRRRNRRWLSLLVGLRLAQGFLIAFAGILSGLAWTALSSRLPAWISRSLLHKLGPLLAVLLVVLVVVAPVLYERLERHSRTVRSNRESFLRQLSIRYDKYLNDPMQKAVRAELELAETPVALRRPELVIESRGVDESPPAPPWVLPPDHTLHELFKEAGGQLLILGDPGAGKSTQLYELARALVRQAQLDPSIALPVVLDLTTWAANHDPVERWLVDTIVETYKVRKEIAQGWVDTNQITPLLDALDVMAEDDQARCVAALNTYHNTNPKVPMVVCCRREEYARIGDALEVRCAVTLQPLTDKTIDVALVEGGPKLDRLRTVVANDPMLRDALRTPLVLSMAVVTYSDLRDEQIPPVTDVVAWRRQLFGRYVRRMLLHRPRGDQEDDLPDGDQEDNQYFTEEGFERALAWLAHALRSHDMNVFYLERLQADWLPDAIARSRYARLIGFALLSPSKAIRPVAGTNWSWAEMRSTEIQVLGLVLWLVIVSVSILPWMFRSWLGRVLACSMVVVVLLGVSNGSLNLSVARTLAVAALVIILLLILIGLLVGGLVGGLKGQAIDEDDLRRVNEGIRSSARSALILGFVSGLTASLGAGVLAKLAGGLVTSLIRGLDLRARFFQLARSLGRVLGLLWNHGADRAFAGALLGFMGLVLLGMMLTGLIILASRLMDDKDVDELFGESGLIEGIVHSKRSHMAATLGLGLILLPAALLIGAFAATRFGKLNLGGWAHTVVERLASILAKGLHSAALTRLLSSGGLGGTLVIVLFALVGVLLLRFLDGVLIGGLVGALAVTLAGVFGVELVVVLLVGISTGVGTGLRFGGAAVLKHSALRLALRRSGVVPPHLETFLVEADRLVLLRRIGGGYQFIHQSLRDYFAEQYSPRESPHVAEDTNRGKAGDLAAGKKVSMSARR